MSVTLRDEYKAVAAELRQFARDEGLSPELAEPFPSGKLEAMQCRSVELRSRGCNTAESGARFWA
jgi:hypothetical protein